MLNNYQVFILFFYSDLSLNVIQLRCWMLSIVDRWQSTSRH